jgi:hypothetical protein
VERLIIWMLPAGIRTSHGEEIEEMLGDSTRPIRDGADVAIASVGLRLGRATVPLLAVAVLGIVVFSLGMAHAVQNLQNGFVEVPDHWWSSFIAIGLGSSLFATTVLCLARRRASAWMTRVQ